MTVQWPDSVDEVLGGDQAVAFAQITPAKGAVLSPLTNFGIRDREEGTLTPVNTSVGMWKKLGRIERNPRVAVAYHAREHGFTNRPEYVLVQGTASFSPLSDRGWVEAHRESWERFGGPRDVGPLWERWQRIYHWRVGIEIAVERVVVWPDLACHGPADVFGEPLPAPPAPQRRPARGMAPRIDHRRAARRAARLPHVLLAWAGTDGFPIVVPAEVGEATQGGIALRAPDGLLPPGGRRAGLLAHSFARYTYGQHQRRHTGWLEVGTADEPAVYAPHTESGYWFPPSRFLFRLVSGFATRRGYRQGRRAGFLPDLRALPPSSGEVRLPAWRSRS